MPIDPGGVAEPTPTDPDADNDNDAEEQAKPDDHRGMTAEKAEALIGKEIS